MLRMVPFHSVSCGAFVGRHLMIGFTVVLPSERKILTPPLFTQTIEFEIVGTLFQNVLVPSKLDAQ